MKNRHLLSLLLAAFVGFFVLVVSWVSFAGNPGGKLSYYSNSPDYLKKANQVTGIISPDDVIKSQRQAEQLRLKSGAGLELNWAPMGPTNIAGPIWSAIIDNRDANGVTIYAGAPGGGVWRSQNNGLTWHPLTVSDGNIPRVSCLAQTKNGVIFAGTGQKSDSSYKYGNGLYRSTDGNTFDPVPGTAFNPHWLAVSRLAGDPRGERMFAATVGGIYYSDNGLDWTTAIAGDATDVSVGNDGTVLAVVNDSVYLARAGDLSNFVMLSTGQASKLPSRPVGWVRVYVAPSDPNIMYASFGMRLDTLKTFKGKLLGVYRSGDGGNNWSVIFPENTTYEPYGISSFNANAMAVSPANPDLIYLGSKQLWSGKKVGNEQYFDWEVLSNGSTTTDQSFYAPNYHHDYRFQTGNSGKMIISSDGGVTVANIKTNQITFQTTSYNLQVARLKSIANTFSKDYVMGGADRGGTFVVGAYYPSQVNNPLYGYQVWKDGLDLADEGRTGGTCAWSKINTNLVVISNVDSNSSTYRTIRRRELTDLTYDNDPLGSDIIVPNGRMIPFILSESFNFTNTFDSTTYKNNTDNPIPAGTVITANSKNAQFPFVYTTPKTIPAHDSIQVPDPIAARFIMYTSKTSKYGFFMTKYMLQFDHGPEWYCIGKESGQTFDVSAIAMSNDMNTLWAGTQNGVIYRLNNLIMAHDSATADIGSPTCVVSMTIDTALFYHRYVTGISVDPNDSRRVMVTLGNYGNADYVYLTENGLDSIPTWRNVTGNLPQSPVHCGLIELHNKNYGVVGTEWGVFSTSDLTSASPTWAPAMANMGNVEVTALSQQNLKAYPMLNYGEIYASTWGRGFFRDTTYLTPVGIDPVIHPAKLSDDLRISPNPVTDYAEIGFTLSQSGNTTLYVYNLSGDLVMGGNLGMKQAGDNSSRINFSCLSPGMYIVRINNSYGKVVKQ